MILEVVITATQVSPVHKKHLLSLNQKVRLAESKYRCTIKVKSLLHPVIRKLTSSEQKVLVCIKQGHMSNTLKKRMSCHKGKTECCKKGKA